VSVEYAESPIIHSFIAIKETKKQPKKADVPVNHVVLPAAALLHSDATPFRLGQKATLGERLGEFFGEDHMTAEEKQPNKSKA